METERGVRPGRWKWITVVASFAVAIVAVAVTAWWLIHPLGAGDPQARVSAVQATFTITFGVGGLATLALFARRQWLQEQAHRLDQEVANDNRHDAEQRRELDRQVAVDAKRDAEERRVTDLYVKASEQLGHAKAPVRLAGLYALERLGENYPAYRQQIVDVYCAYLRMPYDAQYTSNSDHSADEQVDVLDATTLDADKQTPGELQVRITAQRLLARNLGQSRKHQNRSSRQEEQYWELQHIDLAGATLISPDFHCCDLPTASFNSVKVYGAADFRGSNFTGDATFDRAYFASVTSFSHSRFLSKASFFRAGFDVAEFDDVKFEVGANFEGSMFVHAIFDGSLFRHETDFSNTQFLEYAGFNTTNFDPFADFSSATLSTITSFRQHSSREPLMNFESAKIRGFDPAIQYHLPAPWSIKMEGNTGFIHRRDSA